MFVLNITLTNVYSFPVKKLEACQ